jgi:hypothetical protein
VLTIHLVSGLFNIHNAQSHSKSPSVLEIALSIKLPLPSLETLFRSEGLKFFCTFSVDCTHQDCTHQDSFFILSSIHFEKESKDQLNLV